MAQWIGYMVSIETEDKGTYQGEISAATGTEITLTKPFCNGIPCLSSEITIKAEDISNLQLIEKQESPSGQSTVTVAKPIPKRAGRTSSCSELASSNKSSTYNGNHSFNKSKPIDIDVKQQMIFNELPNSFKSKSNKSKGKWGKGWKDEQCFGSPLDHILNKEFDFEKNLALFDKQAIWDEINSQKPDVVRQTDHGRRQTSKYRHDENVITSVLPTTYRQITVPKQEFCEYVTDEGLIIPTISKTLRNKLWAAADRLGLTWERRIELMGRAAAEMALQLVGGGHRLNPHNSHQCPTVVILCSADRQGAMGINAARHLASHGVNTIVYIPSADKIEVKQELALYKLTKNKVITTVSRLPQVADLIITSLSELTDNAVIHTDLSDWANNNKAPILALDPPSEGTSGISTKFTLVPVLPLAHSPDNGKIYLCNLGFPLELFHEVGIKYKSPFGSKFVIPLHPNDDA